MLPEPKIPISIPIPLLPARTALAGFHDGLRHEAQRSRGTAARSLSAAGYSKQSSTFTFFGLIGTTTLAGANDQDPRLKAACPGVRAVGMKHTSADPEPFTPGLKSSVKPLPDGVFSGFAVVPGGPWTTLTELTPGTPVNVRKPCLAPFGRALMETCPGII